MQSNGFVKISKVHTKDGSEHSDETIVAQLQLVSLISDASITWVLDELEACSLLHPHASLVVDFHEVQHASVSLVSGLMFLNERVKARGGSLKLCSLGRNVRELFELAGVNRLVQLDTDLRSALRTH